MLALMSKDDSGSVLVRISAGFGSSSFWFGGSFSSTVFGFGTPKPRSGLVFHPWKTKLTDVASFGLLACDDNRLGTRMVVFLV